MFPTWLPDCSPTKMAHWTEKYVGKPYIKNEYDCTHLVLQVLQNEFGFTHELPTERVDSPFGLSALIDRYKEELAVKLDKPQEGAVVLLKCRGRINHIGIYTVINRVKYIIHNLKPTGCVCIHKLREMKKYGMEVEGFYTFQT